MKSPITQLLSFSALLLLTACSSNQDESTNKEETNTSEWITLFDGSSTEALRGYKMDDFPEGIWQVEDGVLMTNPDTNNVDLITKQRFENFELAYEWAVDTAANSGVFFHVQEKMDMESGNGNSPNWLENFEIQILDDLHFNDTAAVRSAGSLYDLITPSNKILVAIGDFNKAKLVHKDGHVEHWLNDTQVLDFTIGSPELKEILASSKFKNNPGYGTDKEGRIMFQHHGQKVYFKNIRVREL